MIDKVVRKVFSFTDRLISPNEAKEIIQLFEPKSVDTKLLEEGYREMAKLAAQIGISFKADLQESEQQGIEKGRKEMAEWVEHNMFYIAVELPSGELNLSLMNNGKVLAKRWQDKFARKVA